MQIEPGLEDKVSKLVQMSSGTLSDLLGVKYEQLSKNTVIASMEVIKQIQQPFGLLHGGASVALAESLASVGAWLNVDESKFFCVGLEINANHLRAVREGIVRGRAEPLHRGRTTQVWQIMIEDEKRRTVCVSRCSISVQSLR
jgi:1,4-dihydroxy-2-naphthoyl-CoA hydrolase